MKRKKMIFHIGCGSGFFSEYLGMVFALAYCKIHNIEFKLYSKDANFAYRKGWTDFFEPFCEEVDENFHSVYNMRIPFPSLAKMMYKKIVRKISIPSWFWKKYSWWYAKVFLTAPFYKRKYHFDYYTHDLWNKIQKFSKHNTITIHKFLTATWKFNAETLKEITYITEKLNLPDVFIGTQIRAGDKATEAQLIEFSVYMEKIKSLNTYIFDLFILTDDYRIIAEIRDSYPEYRIFTLCNEEANGYENSKFQRMDKETKRRELIKLFASIEILWKSELLVASLNANPSLFLYHRQHPNAHWIDYKSESISKRI